MWDFSATRCKYTCTGVFRFSTLSWYFRHRTCHRWILLTLGYPDLKQKNAILPHYSKEDYRYNLYYTMKCELLFYIIYWSGYIMCPQKYIIIYHYFRVQSLLILDLQSIVHPVLFIKDMITIYIRRTC